MADTCIFKRIEKKYFLTEKQYKSLTEIIGGRLTPDEHGRSTICSLYLDTPDFLLIRNSIDATCYKEKLRIRSYGTPTPDSKVFLELKKKFEGVVYKRRVSMPLADALHFVHTGVKPFSSQIMNELEWSVNHYEGIAEAVLICYERDAFYDKNDPTLRITFDTNVRYRCGEALNMCDGDFGKQIIPDNTYLMEIKTAGTMPKWLSEALSDLNIFGTSFSKYGTAFREINKSGITEQNSTKKIG